MADPDQPVEDNIETLIAREHELRSHAEGRGLTEEEQAEQRALEVRLDQLWDLLRRRRALRAAGEDPSQADVRPEEVVEHYAEIIGKLDRKPAVVGHSFGGLLAQIVAGRGLASVAVAIDPAPFRGVLPLPISALKSARPVLGNPANRNRAVPLTYDQFRFAFANAVSEEEAKDLYETYAVPAPGAPLFQAATANFNPWTEAKVDSKNPDRGPLLIISGEKDHTVPWALANAAYKKQQHNEGVTEIVEIPGRGHALTIDSGWREVADKALEFVKRFS